MVNKSRNGKKHGKVKNIKKFANFGKMKNPGKEPTPYSKNQGVKFVSTNTLMKMIKLHSFAKQRPRKLQLYLKTVLQFERY